MTNKMADVAKLLGVELGEEFVIKGNNNEVWRITEDGLQCLHNKLGWLYDSDPLAHLLMHSDKVIKKPWLPKDNKMVWQYSPLGKRAESMPFELDFMYHLTALKCGLIFRTKEEAETIGKERYEKLLAEYENGTICDEVE